MATIQYIVKSAMRWDNIANDAYGDPGKYDIILKANPNITFSDVVPEGTVLQITIITEDTATINSQLLPPWLQ